MDASVRQALSILVVDDEPGLADAIADLLRIDGHQVSTACDGDEALEVSSTVPFHLVISDLLMPRMPGDRLLDAMRAREAAPFWFAIMSSVSERLVRQRTTGYDRYIAKPLDPPGLQALVRECAASPAIAERLLSEARGVAERPKPH